MKSAFSARIRSHHVCAVLLSVCVVVGASGDGGVMRYKYTAEPLTYRFVMQTVTEMSGGMFGDASMKSAFQQAGLCDITTKSSSGGASVVEMTYTALKMHQDNPMGGGTFFDTTSPEFKASKKEDMDSLARAMSSMVGVGITLTVDGRGNVSKVEHTDMFTDMIKELGAHGPGTTAAIEQMFGEDGIKSLFSQLFVVLPETAIKPGESWTTSSITKVPVLGGIKRTAVWKYVGDESIGGRSVARFNGVISMESVPAEPGAKAEIPGMQMSIDGQGNESSAVVFFDVDAGRMMSFSLSGEMPATMSIKMPPMGNQPEKTMTMKMKSKMGSKMTLVGKDAPVDPDGAVKKPEAGAAVGASTKGQ